MTKNVIKDFERKGISGLSRGTSVLKRVRRRKIPLTEEEETEIGMIQPQVEELPGGTRSW